MKHILPNLVVFTGVQYIITIVTKLVGRVKLSTQAWAQAKLYFWLWLRFLVSQGQVKPSQSRHNTNIIISQGGTGMLFRDPRWGRGI